MIYYLSDFFTGIEGIKICCQNFSPGKIAVKSGCF